MKRIKKKNTKDYDDEQHPQIVVYVPYGPYSDINNK